MPNRTSTRWAPGWRAPWVLGSAAALAVAAAVAGMANAIAQPQAPPIALKFPSGTHHASQAQSSGAKPQRIMSMSLCTDLLLLQLVPKDRIASVTYLAHPGVELLLPPGMDDGVPINRGTSEDIINQKPDLILASTFSTPVARRLGRKAGARIVEVEDADTFPEIVTVIRKVAYVVGEPARGEELISEMNATLAELDRTAPAKKITVVAWSGGDSIPGKATLANAIIEAAGAVNLAATPGYTFSTFGVEQLLKTRPDALLYGGMRGGIPSLQSDQGQHRVVRRLYQHRRVAYAETAYSCGLPQSADAAADLRRRLASLPKTQAMP